MYEPKPCDWGGIAILVLESDRKSSRLMVMKKRFSFFIQNICSSAMEYYLFGVIFRWAHCHFETNLLTSETEFWCRKMEFAEDACIPKIK